MTSIKDQINKVDADGNTPLHKAAQGDFINQVNDYIKNGADVYAKNKSGHTPGAIAGPETKPIIERIVLENAIPKPGRGTGNGIPI